MAQIYYEMSPAPQTDGTNIVINSSGEIDLGASVTTKLSKVDDKIDKPASATEGQVLTYRNNEWVADDSQGGGQFVIIAKGEFYEGQTVTATKGEKSKSAVISSGVARIPVDEGGVWTLTLSSGKTWNTPNMTYYGEYEVALAPNGSTVTPTDDIQTWLKCANLNKSYTTISQVLADTNTLSALISDNNASDYLARSTTWASDVCSNESAMTYIGLNDYCANKLLADSTWSEAICNAKDSSGNDLFEKVLNVKVPPMISNTKPSGVASASTEWDNNYLAYKAFDGYVNTAWTATTWINAYVSYQFTSPKRIKKARFRCGTNRVKNFKIQGSNNGSDWTDLYTGLKEYSDTEVNVNISDTTLYLHYRLFVADTYGNDDNNVASIEELQFYGREEA